MPGLSVVDVPGIDQYTAPQPSSLQDAYDLIGANTGQNPDPSPPDYVEKAKRAAARYGIDPDKYVRLINQESGFNPNAQSPVGALGLAQFMPQTAQSLGIDPMNPDQALDAGAKYLRQQVDYFGGDFEKGLAAYNAGAGNVQRAVTQGGDWRANLPEETKQYLSIINGDGPLPTTGMGLGAKIGSLIRPDMIGGSDTPDNGTPPLITQLGRQAGGFRDTETQTDPNANTSDPFALIGRAYNAVNPAIPYVTPAIENVVKPVAGVVANQIIPGGNLINAATGFNPGRTAADALIPSRAADIALTLAPEVGKVGEAADAVRGAVPGAVEAAQGAYRAAVPEVGAGSYLAGVGRGGDLERQVAEQAARDAANAPLPGQKSLFSDVPDAPAAPSPRPEPGPQAESIPAPISNKFLTAAEQEARLRTRGIPQAEIRAGRAAQARGISGSMAGEQSIEEAGQAASAGANQGGSLRQTFIPKVSLSPEEGQSLVKGLQDQVISGHLSDFDYLRLVHPKDGVIVKLASDNPTLQPSEIRLINRVFGGEPNATLEDIAGELQQVEGLGTAKNVFGRQAWPPTEPGAFETSPSFQEAKPGSIGPELRTPNLLQARRERGLQNIPSFDAPTPNPNAANMGFREQVPATSLSEAKPIGYGPELRTPSLNQARLQRGLTEPSFQGTGEVNPNAASTGLLPGPLLEAGPHPGGPLEGSAFKAESPEDVIAAQKAMGMRGNAHALADSTFSFARQMLNEAQGMTGSVMTLKSSLSPPFLRQGSIRLVTNPFEAFQEFGRSLNAARSEEGFKAFTQVLKDNPWSSIKVGPNEQFSPFRGFTIEDLASAPDASRTVKGFQLREAGAGVSADARSPEFQGLNSSAASRAVEKIPGIVQSDRQAAAQFNANVVGRYSEVASKRWKMEESLGLPHDRRDYSAILDTILHQQQYGGVAQRYMPAFFSTRALSGRVQSLADVFVQPGSLFQPSARQEAVRGLMALVGYNAAALGLLSQTPGFSVQMNNGLPTLRGPGGLHIDPWAGFNPIVKLPIRIAGILQKELGNDGWQKDANWDDLFAKVGSQAVGFARNQLGPIPSKSIDVLGKRDYLGHPYSLTGDVKSGRFFRDLAAPFVVDDMIQSYAEDGLRGLGLTTPLSFLSAGVGNYTTQSEARDDKTKALGYGDSFNGLNDYGQRQEVTKAVQAEGNANPKTSNQIAADQVRAGLDKDQQGIDAALQAGQLTQKYSDASRFITAERLGSGKLQSAFFDAVGIEPTSEFSKRFSSLMDEYRSLDVKDEFGQTDFDATKKAQQAWLAQQPEKDRALLTSYTDYVESQKSDTQKGYDKYNQAREAAGYFNIDPKDPQAAAKRAALDKANPDIDVDNWYYNGGTKDGSSPTLNSPEAVDKALARNLPNRPVKFTGLARNIAESPGTKEAWEANKTGIVNYYDDDLVLGNGRGLTEARKLVTSTHDREYSKPLDQMDAKHRSEVLSQVRQGLIERNPRLDAALLVFGRTKEGRAQTPAAYNLAEQMVQHFEMQRIADGYVINKPKPKGQ